MTTTRSRARGGLLLSAALGLLALGAPAADPPDGDTSGQAAPAKLEETRLTLGKWIETQQIISKERRDWQQGKEILTGRLDLAKKEVSTLQEQIVKAQTSAGEAGAKKAELAAQNDALKDAAGKLVAVVTAMEADVRQLWKRLPEHLQVKLQPLYQRIPEDAATTRISVAELFQNVLGILDALNKANNEITVSYEVRTLQDGRPAEVKAIYVGLAQAWYVSSGGEAGIGHPTDDGWRWVPSKAIADSVLMALDILQGKQSPAFVPLPVELK